MGVGGRLSIGNLWLVFENVLDFWRPLLTEMRCTALRCIWPPSRGTPAPPYILTTQVNV